MKNIFLFIIIIVSYGQEVLCQDYSNDYANYDYAKVMLLSMQPNARSEAMGRGQVAMYGDAFSIFNNPASSSFNKGLNAEYSHLEINDSFRKDAFLRSFGLSYNLDKYGSFAFNTLYLDLGDMQRYYISDPVWHESEYINRTYLYMMNYSYKIFNDFSLGFNLNYFNDTYPKGYYRLDKKSFSVFLADAGILKKFTLNETGNINNIYFGLSFTNIFNPLLDFTPPDYQGIFHSSIEKALPSTFQAGLSYEYQNTGKKVWDLSILKSLLCAEYKDLLNSKYYSSIQLGEELTILEMLQLRLGLYTNQMHGKEFYLDRSDFTYGAGINIPIGKFYKLGYPFEIKFNYTNLPYPLTMGRTGYWPEYSIQGDNNFNEDRYYVYSISIRAGI